MTDYQELVGRDVISLDAGLGRVIGLDDLGMENNEFLVIEYGKDKAKSYFNTTAKKNFRELTTVAGFQRLVEGVGEQDSSKSFNSKQERINYFKSQSKAADVKSLFDLLELLVRQEDLGAVEVQIRNRVLDSLALELSIIQGKDIQSAKEELKNLFTIN